jgi:ATP synthase F1 epsilon subunit
LGVVGQKRSAIAQLISVLQDAGAMPCAVVASGAGGGPHDQSVFGPVCRRRQSVCGSRRDIDAKSFGVPTKFDVPRRRSDMSGTLKLEIITPAATAYSADVQMVTLLAVNGQIGIYPSHVALLTRILPGEMIVRKDGRDEFLAVGEGLVEITGDRVAVITDMAIAVDKIDEARSLAQLHVNARDRR